MEMLKIQLDVVHGNQFWLTLPEERVGLNILYWFLLNSNVLSFCGTCPSVASLWHHCGITVAVNQITVKSMLGPQNTVATKSLSLENWQILYAREIGFCWLKASVMQLSRSLSSVMMAQGYSRAAVPQGCGYPVAPLSWLAESYGCISSVRASQAFSTPIDSKNLNLPPGPTKCID